MTDFRALCAELVAWADKASAHYYQSPDVLIRARAALAEPQPAADGEVAATGKPGLQVEPIPVSERLPEAGGCDAKGRCWQEEPGTATEPPAWNLVPCSRVIEALSKRWLPAYAMPLPKEVKTIADELEGQQ